MDPNLRSMALARQNLLAQTVSILNASVLFGGARPASKETINQAVRDKKLLVVRGKGGELRFPVWPFKEGGGVLEGFAEALAELGRSHAGEDVEAFAFWLNLNPVTGGLRPIDALREGKIKDVLRAAEAAHY
jgi:hypothetical protein